MFLSARHREIPSEEFAKLTALERDAPGVEEQQLLGLGVYLFPPPHPQPGAEQTAQTVLATRASEESSLSPITDQSGTLTH